MLTKSVLSQESKDVNLTKYMPHLQEAKKKKLEKIETHTYVNGTDDKIGQLSRHKTLSHLVRQKKNYVVSEHASSP